MARGRVIGKGFARTYAELDLLLRNADGLREQIWEMTVNGIDPKRLQSALRRVEKRIEKLGRGR